MLQVNFEKKDLRRLYENPDLGKGYYPPGVVKAFVKVVSVMQSVDTVEQIKLYGKYEVAEKQ